MPFFSDLDPSVPTGQDLVSRGDDEIVRVKQAIDDTLGGLDGTVYEDADIDGLNGTVKLTAGKMNTWEARIQASQDDLAALYRFQVGMIMLWSGSIATIPVGWTLCDGVEANGQTPPDLRNRFVAGAGGLNNPGDTGGESNPTTSQNGAHDHGGATGSHSLTLAQLPDFSSALELRTSAASGTSATLAAQGDPAGVWNSGGVRVVGANGNGHTHTISSDGDHTHTVNVVPPFYALAYIMFVDVPPPE